jgi:hypothetical protein
MSSGKHKIHGTLAHHAVRVANCVHPGSAFFWGKALTAATLHGDAKSTTLHR